MKKRITVSKGLSVVLTLVLIVCLVYTVKTRTEVAEEVSAEVSKTVAEAETQEVVEVSEKQEPAAEEIEEEITEQDINNLKMQIEIAQTNINSYEKSVAVYEKMSEGYTEEEINRIIESEVMKCYQENTLLAVEMKTLIMGSFGVQVPTVFGSGESPTEQYEDYISETVSDMVISQVADEEVQEDLKNSEALSEV